MMDILVRGKSTKRSVILMKVTTQTSKSLSIPRILIPSRCRETRKCCMPHSTIMSNFKVNEAMAANIVHLFFLNLSRHSKYLYHKHQIHFFNFDSVQTREYMRSKCAKHI